ncbi:MAG: ADP-ribosylglycohydrolase family protein [Candidatus Lokiarchaeota archaeon]|nr:ADP-ribosylglycohydrolase family protein [Candidatus Lokiarchaeota archaeon]
MASTNEETHREKIAGCWLGKISGGTYAHRVEGWTKKAIQKMNPPLTGWLETHKQQVNDDEQYELIALLALEALSDAELNQLKAKRAILSPGHLGKFWKENLDRRYVFTAERAALENAVDHGVPWEHAADEIFNGRYQNAYFDFIGAQMKGELFGMLSPAWGWHADANPSPETDLARLQRCLELSLDDAWIAHRGVGIAGELFVSAMVAVGIDHDPMDARSKVMFPRSVAISTRMPLPERPAKQEEIVHHGVTAEVLAADIARVKEAMLRLNDKRLQATDTRTFFACIDAVINAFKETSDPRFWEAGWQKAVDLATIYRQGLILDAKKRLESNKDGLKQRLAVLKKDRAFGVHTIPNNAAIAVGLIYGDGDMFQTMHRAAECGLDTDCNGGNAAAILGAYLGEKLVPMYERRFVRDEILSPLTNWKEISLQRLVDRTLAQANRMA